MKLFPRHKTDEKEEDEIKGSARKPLLSSGAARSESLLEQPDSADEPCTLEQPEVHGSSAELRSDGTPEQPELASLPPAEQRRQLVAHLAKTADTAIVDLLPPPDDVRSGDYGGWWMHGVCASDGCIYFVPGGASRVLKMDPNDGQFEVIGPDLGNDDLKWIGGVAVRQPLSIPRPAAAFAHQKVNTFESLVLHRVPTAASTAFRAKRNASSRSTRRQRR